MRSSPRPPSGLIRMKIILLWLVMLGAGGCMNGSGHEIQEHELYAPVPQSLIMVVGDSLSSGYGMARHEGWVALLQERLAQERLARQQRLYRIMNVSRNGATTFVGRRQLSGHLELYRPDIVIIALGGNDALLRLPLEQVHDNLDTMLAEVYAGHARAVLVALELPEKLGRDYARGFSAIYARLAKKYETPLVRHVLDGVYGHRGLMQADGVHPNMQAQAKMLDNIWPALKILLN